MRRFWLKLAVFLGPFAALFSVPLITMSSSREILPVGQIARSHAASADANVVYGPAYTNPDKRYKLQSLLIHDVPVVAIGTSRVMQFRSIFFEGGEHTFYNAGAIVSRVTHIRRLLSLLGHGQTRYLIVGLDQWSYNDNWEGAADDPGVEAEYLTETDALANLRFGVQAWPDLVRGKIQLGKFLRARPDFGVYALAKGNGFRRDGSYLYADILRDPRVGPDFEFRDTFSRIDQTRNRFESGSVVSERAIEETTRMLQACREHGFTPIAFLPPFAPSVRAKLQSSAKHAYLRDVPGLVRQAVEAAGVPFFDFTECGGDGCTDAEFIDGTHGGDVIYGRILAAMAERVPWLAERLTAHLSERIEAARGARTVGNWD